MTTRDAELLADACAWIGRTYWPSEPFANRARGESLAVAIIAWAKERGWTEPVELPRDGFATIGGRNTEPVIREPAAVEAVGRAAKIEAALRALIPFTPRSHPARVAAKAAIALPVEPASPTERERTLVLRARLAPSVVYPITAERLDEYVRSVIAAVDATHPRPTQPSEAPRAEDREAGIRDGLCLAATVCDNYGREGDRLAKEYAAETADELAARIRALATAPAQPSPVEAIVAMLRKWPAPGGSRRALLDAADAIEQKHGARR